MNAPFDARVAPVGAHSRDDSPARGAPVQSRRSYSFTLAVDVAPNGTARATIHHNGQEIPIDMTDAERRGVMRELALPGELPEDF